MSDNKGKRQLKQITMNQSEMTMAAKPNGRGREKKRRTIKKSVSQKGCVFEKGLARRQKSQG